MSLFLSKSQSRVQLLTILYTVIARDGIPKQSQNEIPRGVYPEHKGEIATPSARNDKERMARSDSPVRRLSVTQLTIAGFTLIEVLIAVAILSIVLAAIYSTFFLSHRAIEGMDESLLKLQESRRAIDILRRELDAAFYREKEGNTFLKILDRDIYGKQAAKLTFTTFSTLRPGLSRISYYIEDKDGKLNLFKKVESPYSKEETEGVDIIEDLEAFTIEAKYNDTWVKTWDTSINKKKPDEIRISLSMMIKGRKVTLFDVSQPMVGRTI